MSQKHLLEHKILDWEDWLLDRNYWGYPRYKGRDYRHAWRLVQDLKQCLNTDTNKD